MIFEPINHHKVLTKNYMIVIISLLLCFSVINNVSAQFETADKRFVTQEDRELEKCKINRVKSRTAVVYQKGGLAKIYPDGVINEYFKFDKKGNRIENTRFRNGRNVDTKWIYEYDENGNVIKLTGIDNVGRTAYIRNSKYDQNNNEIERSEYKNTLNDTHKTLFKYINQNMLAQAENYNSSGKKLWTEKYTYDGIKLMKMESINDLGETVSVKEYKHNDAGLIIEEIDASPDLDEPVSIESYIYDEAGRVTEHKTGSFRQLYSYNQNGDVDLDILYNILKTRQHKYQNRYGDNGLLIESTRYSPIDKVVYVTKFEYEYY